MLKVRRAIISVWDKRGILELSKVLNRFNVEIISTGKTAALLREHHIPVREAAQVTGFPEIFSGRVKTLHPAIFGGILVNKKNPLHMEDARKHHIIPVDLVVVNLYPFIEKLQEQLSFDEMIEYIDIGGPSMLRAGAKNFKNVAVASSPAQYKTIIHELEEQNGCVNEELCKKLACDVFRLTRQYDDMIYAYLRGTPSLTLALEKEMDLRYGENPHQKAGLYQVSGASPVFKKLQGKELSFNNFLDMDTSLATVRTFSEPACVIVKHASICGVGVDKKSVRAYKKAQDVDPLSAFGGVISLNRKVDKDTAEAIVKSDFKECVTAPAFSREALKLFSTKKNLRVVEVEHRAPVLPDIRTTYFGYLVQDSDAAGISAGQCTVVTKRKPTARETSDLLLAWHVCKFVKSNAIVAVRNGKLLGVGAGQPSRVGSMSIALEKAAAASRGAVLASDGFFPKEDNIRLAAKKGVTALIQPGGSIKDADIIKVCDEQGIAMMVTGVRHFRH